MSWKFLKLLLPFAVALPLGLALGRRDAEPSVAGPISAASPERLERAKREPLDLQELLRDFAAEQQAWDHREADPMVDLLEDWTEEELKSALEEALTLPRCVTRMGGERRLPWVLIGAWVKKNPDAVAAWIEGVRSADIKEELVREALRNWPEERAMEGIEFLLEHHWKPGKTYHTEIIPRALEDRAREGAEAMIGLLARLAEAKVDIGVESLDFPTDFDFAELVGSDGFQAHDKGSFQDVVFSEWQSSQPREMLAWMEETGDWTRFNDLLDPPAAAAVRAAIGRGGISVPPPVVEPDPFADP